MSQTVWACRRVCAENTCGEYQPRTNPAATTATTADTPASSAARNTANGRASEKAISLGGSAMTRWTCTDTQPAAAPSATPPVATSANSPIAAGSENAPVSTATSANLQSTSPAASLSRLSPSMIVTIRRGIFRLRITAVAATASDGETMAPSRKATAQGVPGIRSFTTTATAAAVNRTRLTARIAIGRQLARKSRQEVKIAAW